jgi:hypothetical protein
MGAIGVSAQSDPAALSAASAIKERRFVIADEADGDFKSPLLDVERSLTR